MKLAFTVLIDVSDDPSETGIEVGDRLADQFRAHLTTAIHQFPLPVREVRIWARSNPNPQKNMRVEAIVPVQTGGYRVRVRAEDNRTVARRFETYHAAKAWANKIDPLPLPPAGLR